MAKLTDADVMTGFNPTGFSPPIESADEGSEDVKAAIPDAEEQTEATASEAADERPPASTEAEVEVSLDGRRLRVQKDVADAFTREINRRDGTRGAELQQLRERLARLEGVTSTRPAGSEAEKRPVGPTVPNPELQIENPEEYQKQLLEYVQHQQEERARALAQQYEEAEAAKERERSRRAAWEQHVESFYGKPENSVLRNNRDIVDLVLAQNQEKLADLPVDEGFNELGRLARERLAQLAGVAPEVKARKTPKPPTLEGGGRRAGTAAPAPTEEGPRSLTEAIRERRRQAAVNFSKGGDAISRGQQQNVR